MAPRLCVRSIVVALALLFATPSRADLRRMEAEKPPQATTPQRPPSRRGSELVGRGLGHFPQLQSFCDIPVLFASENSAPPRLCGKLYRGVLVGL
jgi:hypothetical protein